MAARSESLVPVFPLPDVVLFPHARLPLHVFELRYRTMVRDALSGGRVLAIATLLPGWERDYHLSPAFHPLACLARFERVEWLPNDCYDLVVAGVERVRLGAVRREFPYRACEVERLRSLPMDEGDPLAAMERSALLREAERLVPLGAAAWVAPPVVDADASLEALVGGLAQVLRIDTATRLDLLALDSVLERARRLHECMSGLAEPEAPGETDTPPGTN